MTPAQGVVNPCIAGNITNVIVTLASHAKFSQTNVNLVNHNTAKLCTINYTVKYVSFCNKTRNIGREPNKLMRVDVKDIHGRRTGLRVDEPVGCASPVCDISESRNNAWAMTSLSETRSLFIK